MINHFDEFEGKAFIEQQLKLINEGNWVESVNQIWALGVPKSLLVLGELVQQSQHSAGLFLYLDFVLLSSFNRIISHKNDFTLKLDHISNFNTDLVFDLGTNLVNNLYLALTLASDSISSIDSQFKLDVTRAIDKAKDYTRMTEFYMAIAQLDFKQARELAVYLNRYLAIVRDNAVLTTYENMIDNHLSDLNLDFGNYPEEIFLISEAMIYILNGYIPSILINRCQDAYGKRLFNALDEALYLQQQEPSPVIETIVRILQDIIGDDLSFVTFEGVDVITPDVLAYEVAPYIQTLRDIQQVYAEVTGKEFKEPRIVQMHNLTPKFEFWGLGNALGIVKKVTSLVKTPGEIALQQSQNEQLKLQNERLQIENEALIQKITIERDKGLPQTEADVRIALLNAKVEKTRLENRKIEIELEERRWKLEKEQLREYTDIAIVLLKEWSPNITIQDLDKLVPRLAVALFRANGENRLNLRLGWHDVPRSLPEIRKDE